MKIVAASSKDTLCFLWLRRFLASSHSTSNVVLPPFTVRAFLIVLVLFSSFEDNNDPHAESKTSGMGSPDKNVRVLGTELAGVTKGISVLRQNPIQRIRQHLPPPGPVVIYVRTPKVECMRNALLFENVG